MTERTEHVDDTLPSPSDFVAAIVELLSTTAAYPLLLSAVMIILTKALLFGVRGAIIRNTLFRIQFMCHPILIAALVAAAPQHPWCTYLLVPVAFCFGVEPADPHLDSIYWFFFYLHHEAPVLAACARIDPATFHTASTSFLANNFQLATGLLMGHAWAVHPIEALKLKKIIDKQKIFWHYMAIAFALKVNWWRSFFLLLYSSRSDAPPKTKEENASVLVMACLPMALQYIGRWGIYFRECQLTGCHRRSHPKYDAFNWNKQFVEPLSFLVSWWLARKLVVATASA